MPVACHDRPVAPSFTTTTSCGTLVAEGRAVKGLLSLSAEKKARPAGVFVVELHPVHISSGQPGANIPGVISSIAASTNRSFFKVLQDKQKEDGEH